MGAGERPPVPEADLDRSRAVGRPVDGDRDPRAERDHRVVEDAGVEGGGSRGVTAGQRHGGRLAQAELGLQAGDRIGDGAHAHLHGVGVDRHLLDVTGLDAVLGPHASQPLDRGVRGKAGGVVLEQVVPQVPLGAGSPKPSLRVEAVTVGLGESLHRLDRARGGGVAPGRQAGRQQAVGGRLAGVERLAHRAEHRLQACRLCGGDAEGRGGGVAVEAEQVRAGRRRAEGARRSRGVEAPQVVLDADRAGDAALGLVAGNEGGGDRPARAVALLGQGEQRRQHRHGRVASHGLVDVVVVEGVGRGAVDEGGVEHGEALAPPDQGDAAVRRAVLEQLVREQRRGRLDGAGERHADPVEQALAGKLDDVLGKVVEADAHSPLGQVLGEAHRHSLSIEAAPTVVWNGALWNGAVMPGPPGGHAPALPRRCGRWRRRS